MSRQIAFHALESDLELLLRQFMRNDEVGLALRDSATPALGMLSRPNAGSGPYVLWHRTLSPGLARYCVADAQEGPYYRLDPAPPVLELTVPLRAEWLGRPALRQGRLWADTVPGDGRAGRWLEAGARWIRRHWIAVRTLRTYVGPAALEWQRQGGVLVPYFSPPPTEDWRGNLL